MVMMPVRKPQHPAASSRFGDFKPEAERIVRTQDIRSNPATEGMKEAWMAWKEHIDHSSFEKNYVGALGRIRNLEYSAKDVEDFSIAISGFQGHKGFPAMAGAFLSALINNCQGDSVIIHTVHLAELPNALGYLNTKNIRVDGSVGTVIGDGMTGGRIIVKGDVGQWAGDRMKGGDIRVEGNSAGFINGLAGGTITVEGNVDSHVGASMTGGSIIVNGDVGDYFGYQMQGGTVRVKGNAGHGVGFTMTGGEIHLDGDSFGLPKDIRGGKIFHKGRLILDK
jgi:hypothetical protein